MSGQSRRGSSPVVVEVVDEVEAIDLIERSGCG